MALVMGAPWLDQGWQALAVNIALQATVRIVGGEVYAETTFQEDGKWATRLLHWPLLVEMMGGATKNPTSSLLSYG